jgi:hypothetical protein
MTARHSQHFLWQHAAAPPQVQKAFEKQCRLLLENLGHPSLRANRYHATLGLWQGLVNRDWRFYFTTEGGEYHLHEIKQQQK